MSENDRGGIAGQGANHDLSLVHAGAVDAAEEQFFKTQGPVACIQTDHGEDLLVMPGQLQLQVVGHRSRTEQAFTTGEITPIQQVECFGNHLVFCTAARDIGTVDQGEGSVHGVILQSQRGTPQGRDGP